MARRPRTYHTNVPQTDYRGTCQCGRPFVLFFNGGEMDSTRCECGRRYVMIIKRVDITIEGPPEKS